MSKMPVPRQSPAAPHTTPYRPMPVKNTSSNQAALSFVTKFLVMLLGMIIAVIVLGTAFAFVRNGGIPTGGKTASGADNPGAARQKPLWTIGAGTNHQKARTPAADTGAAGDNQQIFTGIGKIRSSTKDGENATVILSIAFPYDPSDVAFSEELASKTAEMRKIAGDYFRTKSLSDIRAYREDQIKVELLRQFNARLQLGAIETLYFNDFMVF